MVDACHCKHAESDLATAMGGCSITYSKPGWQTDTGGNFRTVGDVSAVANPSTGVAVYGPVTSKKSGWQVYGGTSVASPLIAGMCGSNGRCGNRYLCTGKVGCDGPTGLGTPDGNTAF